MLHLVAAAEASTLNLSRGNLHLFALRPHRRQFTMKTLTFLPLLVIIGLHGNEAVLHSLKYFLTFPGVPNFPEFVGFGLVDETQLIYYDSNTKTVKSSQDWMEKMAPQHWERQTVNFVYAQEQFKTITDNLKEHFNQTGGVHICQLMGGCEWDDETEEVNSFTQIGYDGEDFISFDLKTETWITANQQAVIKNKWDALKAVTTLLKHALTRECPKSLKRYLDLGRSFLVRTELPSVSLLQKTPSSPVSCHATGFYPNRAALMWRKDGEELHENVDQGEILPNQDGTFQMSAGLNLSSVPPGDWGKYECVFQLSGVKEDMVTRLGKEKMRSNWGKTGISGGEDKSMNTTAIIIAAVCVLVLVLIAGGVGFFIYKQKKAKRPPGSVRNPEVLEELNPRPSV